MRQERPVEDNHVAKSQAIRDSFITILDYITPHITMIAEEAQSCKLIDYKLMMTCTDPKHPRKEVARKFLKKIEKCVCRGDATACDTFLRILRLPKFNLSEAATLIEATAQREFWRNSKPEANATACESDSGAVDSAGTLNSEQSSSLHPESYSEPVRYRDDLQSLSQLVSGASHDGHVPGSGDIQLNRLNINSSPSIGGVHESTDGSTSPQTASSQKATTAEEHEEEEHLQPKMQCTPVSATIEKAQTEKDLEMEEQKTVVPSYNEIIKRLSERNKELERLLCETDRCLKAQEECLRAQEELIIVQKQMIKLSKETTLKSK